MQGREFAAEDEGYLASCADSAIFSDNFNPHDTQGEKGQSKLVHTMPVMIGTVARISDDPDLTRPKLAAVDTSALAQPMKSGPKVLADFEDVKDQQPDMCGIFDRCKFHKIIEGKSGSFADVRGKLFDGVAGEFGPNNTPVAMVADTHFILHWLKLVDLGNMVEQCFLNLILLTSCSTFGSRLPLIPSSSASTSTQSCSSALLQPRPRPKRSSSACSSRASGSLGRSPSRSQAAGAA